MKHNLSILVTDKSLDSSYTLSVDELYQQLKIREFNLVQFSSEDEIISNAVGILDYLQELISECGFKSKWPWMNMVMKYFSGREFFNLIISCQSVAEVAERIEFDGRMNAEFRKLYSNDTRPLSDAMLEEARYLVTFMRILIDEEITFSAAYFRVGYYNQTPFASFELIDDTGDLSDGESYEQFMERILQTISTDTIEYRTLF